MHDADVIYEYDDDDVVSKLIAASRGSPCHSMASCLINGFILY